MKYELFKTLIIKLVQEAVKDEFNYEIATVEVEIPNNVENGNFSTNIALKLTKELGKPPREIASILMANISKEEKFKKVEIAGPGFLNFYITDQYYLGLIKQINRDIGELTIKNDVPVNYNVEFVSANPTGDLHLGHARGAAYGDALARLLARQGNNVITEYYINDAGKQMDNLGLSVKYFYELQCGLDSEFPKDGYGGSEIKAIASDIFKEFNDLKLNEEMQWFREIAYSKNFIEIKRILKLLNIEYQVWSSERSYFENNKVEKNLEQLKASGDLYEEEGATWLNTEKYGDDKNRVLRKKDGTLTYFATDIAYHIDKYNRGDVLINIWGGDHHGYMKRVKCAMESLGHSQESIEILFIQMINIVRNDEVVKMSKRAGTAVTIKELLKEIDVEAMRYFFVMRSPDTQVDFDLDVASKQSSENPVFYIQYAHARISSLIDKAHADNIVINENIESLNEMELALMSLVAAYSGEIYEAANKRLPHILCNYLYELATKYHQYYNACPVFTNNHDEISDKINLCNCIKIVIADGLDLLGIQAKNKM